MESFLNHIRLECKILEEGRHNHTPFMKSWLAEGQGIPDQLEEMLEAILSNSIIEKRYGEWQKDPTITYVVRFDMYPSVENIKRNFIGPKSILTIRFSRGSTLSTGNVGGVYGGDKEDPEFNEETGLLENAEIKITCEIPPQTSFELLHRQLRSCLSHELVHAFEDFNRQCQGGRSLMQALGDRSYPGGPKEEGNIIKWLAYILDPAEQKTFIAQTALEVRDGVRNMKRAGRLDRFENIRNIDRILEMTNFWKAYEGLRSWVEETPWERMPKWRQEKIVDLYNSVVKKDDLSPFNRPITTYNQFLKKLRHRWRAFDHDLKNKVGQAATTALYTERPTDSFSIPSKEKLSESIFYQAY